MIHRFRVATAARSLATMGRRWCSEEPTAAQRGAGLYHTKTVDIGLMSNNEHYARGAELMRQGAFAEAQRHLTDARFGEFTFNPQVLMLLARCLMEQKNFEEAKRLLQICDTKHAGTPGLFDMLEEVNYGIELWGEHLAKVKAKQQEYRDKMKRGEVVDKYQVHENRVQGQEIQSNLPMENHQRDYFRKYIGDEARDTIGMYYVPGKGRCLGAKKRIERGQTLFEEKTVLFAPEYLTTAYKEGGKLDPAGYRFIEKGSAKPQKCSHCQGKIENAKAHQCTDCGLYYCSDECQGEAANSYHEYECKILRSDAVRAVRDRLTAAGHAKIFVRWLAMIRCSSVAIAQNGQYANKQPWFDHLAYYEGEHKLANVESEHETSHKLSPTMTGLLAIIYSKLMLVARYGPDVEKLPKIQIQSYLKEIDEDYKLLYDRVKENLDKNSAIYPFLTMVNHSCMPNAVFKKPGQLVATQTIRPNEEVCVAYTPPNVPLDLRYNWLEKHRGFTCTCTYCVFAAEDDQFELESKNDSAVRGLTQMARDEREEWLHSEESTMADGRYTKKGLEEFDERYDKMLEKYPKEFRETLLAAQQKIADDLRDQPVEKVKMELAKRKQYLSTLQKQGLGTATEEEQAAFDILIDTVGE